MNIFIATIADNIATLTAEESWHCTKVLRTKSGEIVRVIDGLGNYYNATLTQVNEKQCLAEITSGPEVQAKRPYYLHLAIAPTKQIDRIEWMVEKAVEIGIDELSFIQCKNSERTVIKTDRIKKIVESAVKQSLQAYIPKVNELCLFKDIISNEAYDQKLIAHCYDFPKTGIKALNFKSKKNLVLIGPEGDFTTDEVTMALAAGFTGLVLGQTRLRTETAGLYTCQAVSILSL